MILIVYSIAYSYTITNSNSKSNTRTYGRHMDECRISIREFFTFAENEEFPIALNFKKKVFEVEFGQFPWLYICDHDLHYPIYPDVLKVKAISNCFTAPAVVTVRLTFLRELLGILLSLKVSGQSCRNMLNFQIKFNHGMRIFWFFQQAPRMTHHNNQHDMWVPNHTYRHWRYI